MFKNNARKIPLAALMFVSVPAPASAAFAADAFDPKNAYGVVAGVLSWKDKSFTAYPVKNRKDKELYDALVARGASAENLALLLDRAATRDAVYAAVKEKAAKAPAGSTFIFYYAGHGVNREGKGAFFAGYDIDRKKAEESGVSPEVIGGIIGQNFKGSKVILLADCCYSGALQTTAQMLSGGPVTASALTSASASNTSAGAWTFSQTVIDAVAGRALLDRDGDGFITFGELSLEIADAMKYRERQLSGSFVPEAMKNAVVSEVKERGPARTSSGAFSTGEYISVPGKAGARTAQILEIRGGDYLAEFYDYSDKVVSTVPAAGAAKIEFKNYPAGSDVNVMWGERPYAAKILKVQDGFHWITYPGWSHSWDEWVMSDRIIETPAGSGAGGPVLSGAEGQVSVEWSGSCYPAVVLKKKAGRAFVHYAGYESSWDEWVGPERLNCK
ncbi:MAG: caspase family protein [Elusimicrobia bacterium]|nr:caspase family protein [Elusimicrobiota bacterium]